MLQLVDDVILVLCEYYFDDYWYDFKKEETLVRKKVKICIFEFPQKWKIYWNSAAKLGMNISEYVRFLIIEDARRSLDVQQKTPSE